MELVPSYAKLVQVTVVSREATGGIIQVEINSGTPNAFDKRINAEIVNTNNSGETITPEYGSIGLVAIDPINNQKGYWIGKLRDSKQEKKRKKNLNLQPGEVGLATESSSLKVSNEGFFSANRHGTFSSEKSGFNITQSDSGFHLSATKVEFNSGDGIFKLNSSIGNLRTLGQLSLVGDSGLQCLTKGNFVVSSGLYKSDERDLVKRIGSIDKFIVKAAESKFVVGSTAAFDAGAFTFNVCSGKITSQSPGGGSSQSFLINVVQGDSLFSLGMGNMNFSTLGPSNYIKFRAGRTPQDVAYSDIKLTRMEILITNKPSTSEIKLGKGNITLTSQMETKIKATTDVTIEATKSITLNATTTMDIKSTGNMTIDCKAIIEMKATQLKLQNIQLLDTGPKVVTPTGTGPLCAIGFCPITGSPHSGYQAMG